MLRSQKKKERRKLSSRLRINQELTLPRNNLNVKKKTNAKRKKGRLNFWLKSLPNNKLKNNKNSRKSS